MVAAVCAAMLIGSLRSGSSASGDKKSLEIEVATAKTFLPAMTVITLDHVISEEVSKDDLPEGRLVRPSQVIGKVLAVPVVKGQVLTYSCFVTEGTGALLAAALPHGMRAVTVTLSSKQLPDSQLLYPGCVVDILVSFRLGGNSDGQAISTTMLRGIQVLAVAGDSIVSASEDEAQGAAKPSRPSRAAANTAMVTLMVDPKQAEALQLAADNGSIAVAIRNPLDKNLVDMEATILSQGRLANSGSALTPAVLTAMQAEQSHSAVSVVQPRGVSPSDANIPIPQPKPEEKHQIRQSPRWGVSVIRGRETNFEELAMPASMSAGRAGARK
jgi:pilus assembly protein CpaB